ncbi:MAG TPA: hypothetical protein VMW08_00635 [Acidimicrobiales bacterium]|nr:hypothetical protein [Acidimicrobiales bacterium]
MTIADWYTRNAGQTPTEDQARCLTVLATISTTPGTLYNLHADAPLTEWSYP